VKLKAALEQTRIQLENAQRFQVDMHKEKAAREALEKKIKEQEEKALLEGKNWEALAAKRGEDLEAEKQKNARLNQGFINSEVDRSLLQEAMAMGLDPDAQDIFLMLPRPTVVPEVVSGADGSSRVSVRGAKEHVAAIQLAKPMLFKKKTPGITDPATRGNLPGQPANQGDLQAKLAEAVKLQSSKDPAEKAKGDEIMRGLLSQVKLK
jgi:hypothetical protein